MGLGEECAGRPSKQTDLELGKYSKLVDQNSRQNGTGLGFDVLEDKLSLNLKSPSTQPPFEVRYVYTLKTRHKHTRTKTDSGTNQSAAHYGDHHTPTTRHNGRDRTYGTCTVHACALPTALPPSYYTQGTTNRESRQFTKKNAILILCHQHYTTLAHSRLASPCPCCWGPAHS